MNTLIFIVIFLLGTLIGSFLNVVIYRFNTGKSIVTGRSICLSCNKTLKWYELIPVVSYLIQGGRCRGCKTRISAQYLCVELITGFVFALLAYHFIDLLSFSSNIFVCTLSYFMLIFALLIVIAVYDIRHKIIPDKLVFIIGFLSLVSIFINFSGVGSTFVIPTLWQILAGPILAIPFALIWLFSRGRLMGLGDSKLILAIGWMLGISQGLAALVISFWIGAIVGLVMALFSHLKITMKTEIPFAPFLILGTLMVLIMGINIFSLAAIF